MTRDEANLAAHIELGGRIRALEKRMSQLGQPKSLTCRRCGRKFGAGDTYVLDLHGVSCLSGECEQPAAEDAGPDDEPTAFTSCATCGGVVGNHFAHCNNCFTGLKFKLEELPKPAQPERRLKENCFVEGGNVYRYTSPQKLIWENVGPVGSPEVEEKCYEDAPFNPICPKCGGCGERYAGEPESVCPVCKGEGEISPSLKVCPECYALLDVSGHYIHCSRGKPQAEDAPSVEPTDENDSWTLRDLLDITSEAIVSGHELSKPLVVEVDDVEYEFLNIICAKDRILLRGWSGKEGGVDHD